MIGTVLDKFEVLQKIGEGGMATVYRGRHTQTGVATIAKYSGASGRSKNNAMRPARAGPSITLPIS